MKVTIETSRVARHTEFGVLLQEDSVGHWIVPGHTFTADKLKALRDAIDAVILEVLSPVVECESQDCR